jgi:ATP diphosphatase
LPGTASRISRDDRAPLIEEAYEVVDAIERSDMVALKDELWRLLFQVVFHARMAEGPGCSASTTSPRRSPTRWNGVIRMFGDVEISSVAAQNVRPGSAQGRRAAGQRRRRERPRRVALALPALLRAAKICAAPRASGFDWPNARAVIPKLAEEIAELGRTSIRAPMPRWSRRNGRSAVCRRQFARKLDIEPETRCAAPPRNSTSLPAGRVRRRTRHRPRPRRPGSANGRR